MSNFQNAYNYMCKLIDEGCDSGMAQVRAMSRYNLDEVEAEGLMEEYMLDQAEDDEPTDDPHEDYLDAVEADADVLRSAGFGTDEDYGCFDGHDDWY